MTIWYYSYNTNKQIDLGSFKLNINLIFFLLPGQSIAMPISFSVVGCILHPFRDPQAQCLSGPSTSNSDACSLMPRLLRRRA